MRQHIYDAALLGKPLIHEEFGKMALRTREDIRTTRDPFFRLAYLYFRQSALQQPPGPLRGSLFWQWSEGPPPTAGQSRAVASGDSTWTLIEQNAVLVADLNARDVLVPGCIPGSSRSFGTEAVGSSLYASWGPGWVAGTSATANGPDSLAPSLSACLQQCEARAQSPTAAPCGGCTWHPATQLCTQLGLPADPMQLGPMFDPGGSQTFWRASLVQVSWGLNISAAVPGPSALSAKTRLGPPWRHRGDLAWIQSCPPNELLLLLLLSPSRRSSGCIGPGSRPAVCGDRSDDSRDPAAKPDSHPLRHCPHPDPRLCPCSYSYPYSCYPCSYTGGRARSDAAGLLCTCQLDGSGLRYQPPVFPSWHCPAFPQRAVLPPSTRRSSSRSSSREPTGCGLWQRADSPSCRCPGARYLRLNPCPAPDPAHGGRQPASGSAADGGSNRQAFRARDTAHLSGRGFHLRPCRQTQPPRPPRSQQRAAASPGLRSPSRFLMGARSKASRRGGHTIERLPRRHCVRCRGPGWLHRR